MIHAGLVLEGGGMRGLYTAGVLDFFLEKDLIFDYVIGVSAGASNAVSYISRQKGRNKIITTAFINDWRYMSIKNLVKNGSLFGMDFIFDEIPQKRVPFDYDTFFNSPITFKVGVTDCKTGKPLYFDKSEMDKNFTALRASISLPFVSPIVHYRGYHLLDGGITDPIPIRQAITDGYQKNMVVLTRNQGYQKKPVSTPLRLLLEKKYRDYPNLIAAMLNRYQIYNKTLLYIEQLEQKGQIAVIRPSKKLNVNRFEKNADKLNHLYELGYLDAAEAYDQIKTVIERQFSAVY
ncbi:MAG: patatin family protein [Syntrophomonadaceae bacterium]|nr:patatin family protein [Syntrophomonadaceae bacterium]